MSRKDKIQSLKDKGLIDSETQDELYKLVVENDEANLQEAKKSLDGKFGDFVSKGLITFL